jgi:hypothetical protein
MLRFVSIFSNKNLLDILCSVCYARFMSNTPIELSERQKSIIRGTVLGDARLEISHGAIEARLQFTHGAPQLGYMQWIRRELSPLITQEIKEYWAGGVGLVLGRFKSYRVASRSHPFLTSLYRQVSVEKLKTISAEYFRSLDALAIAVWYMDDGGLYTHKNNYGREYPMLMINSQSLDRTSNENAASFFRDIYGIRFGIHKNKGWRLVSTDTASVVTFLSLVKPHVLPYFAFKVQLPCLS